MRIARAAEKVFDHQYHYEHLMEVAVEGLRQGNFAPDAGSLMGDSDQVRPSVGMCEHHLGGGRCRA